METPSPGKQREARLSKAGSAAKWAFVLVLAGVAGLIGYLHIFRTHAAETTVKEVFGLVEKGDLEGVMERVDPEGQLGRIWNENLDGARDALLSFLQRYRLGFGDLSFATRAEGDLAEVELRGGRVSLYSQGKEGPPAAFFDLGGSDLVFYLERKDGGWLIEGINYDLTEVLSGDWGSLPF